MDIPIGTVFNYFYQDEEGTYTGKFTIIGHRSIRGKYIYIIQWDDVKKTRESISRVSMLDGIERKLFTLVA